MNKQTRNLVAIGVFVLFGVFVRPATVPSAQEGMASEGLPSSAESTPQEIEAAMKGKAMPMVQERGAEATLRVPLVLERSVQVQTAEGEPIILKGGNYLVEVSPAPPLKLIREAQNEQWTLSAQIGSHQQTLTVPMASSVAGPNEDEHHVVLLLPNGKSLDVTGSYSGVGTRAANVASPALINQALAGFPHSGQVPIQTQQKLLPGSALVPSLSNLKARALLEKPAKTLYYEGLFRDRVVVKFKEGVPVRMTAPSQGQKPDLALNPALMNSELRGRMQRQNLTEASAQTDLGRVNAILKKPLVKKVASVFSRQDMFHSSERAEAELRTGQEHADLGNYFDLTLEPGSKGEELVDELNALPSVEIAYLAPIPVDAQADIPPPTPNFQGNQGFLNAAPQGIDALFAWTFPGGRGNGIRVIDIESSWNTAHEDLPQPFFSNGTFGTNTNHGTAVLGEMVGHNTGFGVTGIASDARYGVVTATRPNGTYSVADAVNVAAGQLNRGDVILIEQHAHGPASGLQCTCNCGQFEYVAMENWQAEFDALQAATSRGIIVVEAAGNGSMNLDDARYNNRFNRSTRDSGAIIVGASDGNLSPTCWTNRGSRVDMHGWGQGVWSTGYGLPDPQNRINGVDMNQWYTNQFSGTSSASPIVTGAVMSLMGIRRAAGIEGMDPVQLRTLLRNTGTPQQNVPAGQIGPLPNLRNTIGQLPLDDCVGLNPNNVAAQNIQSRWKVVDGNHWLLDFANDRAGAERARDTIRHYGMNRSCFIGRPQPSMAYWLVGAQAPSGAFAGEDCLPINPSTLQVQRVAGRWKLVQGNQWVEDFEDKEHEARAALNIIQRHDFRYQCFVKRPNPPMQYWRR